MSFLFFEIQHNIAQNSFQSTVGVVNDRQKYGNNVSTEVAQDDDYDTRADVGLELDSLQLLLGRDESRWLHEEHDVQQDDTVHAKVVEELDNPIRLTHI